MNAEGTTCPEVDVLLELAGERLAAEARARALAHVDGCEACRAAVASLLSEPGPEAPSGERESARARRVSERESTAGAPPICDGDVIDTYVVEALVASGGMSIVYRARDRLLGRRVALKVLREPLRSDRERERFLHEARTTARFAHPNIVTVFGAGETHGHAYLALEYIEGVTLDTLAALEPLPVPRIARIALGIARALTEAHAAGVVHADLKPGNVLVTPRGRVLVVDFGLARARRAEPTEGETPSLAGTPAYMAPEQWRGEEPTAAADVWALGLVVYELFAGARAFEASTLSELMSRVVGGQIPTMPPAMPARTRALVTRCLATRPEERPGLEELTRELAFLETWDPSVEARGPFRGLRAFSREDAGVFFGREAEVALAAQRLAEDPCLFVLGASGAGKSSFVRAGLLPHLAAQKPTRIFELRPSLDANAALARALSEGGVPGVTEASRSDWPDLLERFAADVGEDVVLFVDQLEEVFTLSRVAAEATAFVRQLVSDLGRRGGRLRVVATVREDHLSRLAACAEAPLEGLFVLAPLGRAALVRSLEGPLAPLGYRWEPETLPEAIVESAFGEAAALSLVQFAAARLWEARDDEARTVGMPAYEELGGVAGALTRYADEVVAKLGERGAELTRLLFLRLLAADGTRRVLAREALLAGLGLEGASVLEALLAARLLVVRADAGASEVEVAHESLVLAWPRLRLWLEASREGHAVLVEAEHAARAWDRKGRPDGSTWRGRDLADARRAADGTTVAPVVLEFLEAGERRERAASELRTRRLRLAFAALAAVALVSIAAALAFQEQRRLAVEREGQAVSARATAEHNEADALRLAGVLALERGEVEGARTRAADSLALADDPRTRVLLRRAFGRSLVWSRPLAGWCFSLDAGHGLVAVPAGRDLELLDGASGELRAHGVGHTDAIVGVRFSPREPLVVTGGMDGRMILWSLRGEPLATPITGEEGVYAVDVSPDGRLAVGGGRRGTVFLVDVPTRSAVARMSAGTATINAITFSADGEEIYVGDNDGLVRVWNVPERKVVAVIGTRGGPGIQSLARSPDGATVAFGDASGWVRSADARTHALLPGGLRAHRSIVHALAFLPDGSGWVSGGHDHALRIQRGGVVMPLREEPAAVWDVRFDRAGKLFLASGERAVRALDPAREEPRASTGHVGSVEAVAVRGDVVASGGSDGVVRLWDARSGAERRALRGHEARVWDVRFSEDGARLASASEDQTVRLWDVATGTLEAVLSTNGGTVYHASFGPGGRLATFSKDGMLRLWDLGTSALRDVVRAPGTTHLAYAATGELVTVGSEGVVLFGDHGAVLRREAMHGALRGLALGPEGSLATVDAHGDVLLLGRDLRRRRVLGRAPGRIDDLGFGEGGALFATSVDGAVERFDAASGAHTRFPSHRVTIGALAASGPHVVTGGEDGTVRVFDADGAPRWRVGPVARAEVVASERARLEPHEDGTATLLIAGRTVALPAPAGAPSHVTAVWLAPPLVALGHESGDVQLFDAAAGLLEAVHLHGGVVSLAEEGGALVARSELGTVHPLDLGWLRKDRCALLSELAPGRPCR